MATRPIFIPNENVNGFVQEKQVSFTWHAGLAVSQAQKSIRSLHDEARLLGIESILEISSKSPEPLGVKLSAFNLEFCYKGRELTVESAYQGSKVFQGGGPFTDLYQASSREAKQDPRLKNSGELSHFDFFGLIWQLAPKTAFYDWLYMQAVHQDKALSSSLLGYSAFSDIVFNPAKSFNCQARSAAMYVALARANLLGTGVGRPDKFCQLYTSNSNTEINSIPYEQEPLL